jgi:hypothetical protein
MRRFGLLAATLAKNAFCAIIWSAVSVVRLLYGSTLGEN